MRSELAWRLRCVGKIMSCDRWELCDLGGVQKLDRCGVELLYASPAPWLFSMSMRGEVLQGLQLGFKDV